jgi:hypothetical protein
MGAGLGAKKSYCLNSRDGGTSYDLLDLMDFEGVMKRLQVASFRLQGKP